MGGGGKYPKQGAESTLDKGLKVPSIFELLLVIINVCKLNTKKNVP